MKPKFKETRGRKQKPPKLSKKGDFRLIDKSQRAGYYSDAWRKGYKIRAWAEGNKLIVERI